MAVGDNVLCSCKRKETRKNRKRITKARRSAYYMHKKVEDIVTEKEGSIRKDRKRTSMKSIPAMEVTDGITKKKKKRTKKRRRKKSSKNIEQTRKGEILRAIDEDDIEIHRYERLLGYHKRKSKNMPQVFGAEGLDYVLEVCDSKKFKPNNDSDGGSDFEMGIGNDGSDAEEWFSEQENSEESANEIDENRTDGISEPMTSKKALKASAEKDDSAPSGVDDDEVDDDDSDAENDSNDDGDGMNLKEDIYGRLINRKTGEFVPSKSGAKEKLNELEQKAGLLETEGHLKLKKSLRGLVNRLNEHTLVASVKSFSDIFASNGHNEVKQLLFSEILNAITVGYRLPDRLIIEYAVLVALIHGTVSSEVSSHFVENYIVKLLETIAAPPEGKSLENLCVLLAEFYNFKVIKVIIITEIMQRLRAEMNDKCLTCFKAFLSYCGNTMRKRDLDALQKLITETQMFFAQIPEETMKKQQLRYTVDEINAIKNANVRKFTDIIDSTLHDHYVSIFRGLTRKVVEKEKELPMSVDDIVHVPERGRWWLIGSAWLPNVPGFQDRNAAEKSGIDQSAKFDASLLQLAKKAKMNTAIRRDIFCTIMSAMDEMDAFEKLLRLSLKGQQEREIVHICVHCALRETTYNPFYAAVIDHLCCYHKRFKLTTQYALWDRIRDLTELNKKRRTNLALLIVDLLVKRSVSITVLKVIEFGAIDRLTARFVRLILSAVLTRCTQQVLMDMFRNVVTSSQHKIFSEGLQIFIHMALKKPQKNIDNKLLLSRIEFLDSIWGDDRL